jgi:hypothetical protein
VLQSDRARRLRLNVGRDGKAREFDYDACLSFAARVALQVADLVLVSLAHPPNHAPGGGVVSANFAFELRRKITQS